MTTADERVKQKKALWQENAELRIRLAEADETLRAIRNGEVDAVVVTGDKGEQIFSLVGSDSIYRLIVETMKGAAFTLAFDGQILFCNAQLGELVKCPMENIVGHRLDEFIAESGRADASTFLLAAQRQPVKQRLVFRTCDGTPVPAHVAANVLNQPDGLSICVVANDLSELENSTELIQQLRRQQEELRRSEERLRSLAENSPGVLQRFDRQFRVMWLSPKAEEVTGIPVEQFIGKTNREMGMPADLVDLWEKAMTQVLETAETREVEFSLETPKGKRTHLLRLAPEFGGDG